MNAIWTIARKEFSDGLRNRWIVAIGLLFALLAVGITWFGAAASGQLGFTNVPATIASLASLSTFLIPLIALLLAYDAIVGEEEDGTLALLLTYPLGRGQILLGKFIGHGMILALATLAGFGATALAIAVLVEDVGLATMFWAFGRFILSSILLGWVFLAMAYVLSGRAREKSTAAGLALAVWFFFVLVFDLAMLALLVLSEGRLSPDLLPWLLLFNPADVYRLINLAGLESGGNMAGVLALGVDLPMSTAALWAILCGWVAGALGTAHLIFLGRQA